MGSILPEGIINAKKRLISMSTKLKALLVTALVYAVMVGSALAMKIRVVSSTSIPKYIKNKIFY
jgi:hypothetical protein